tara:strand:+ start:1375 stop:1833 length:459 start_codon:yes stop_codon:yes gene_type:complete
MWGLSDLKRFGTKVAGGVSAGLRFGDKVAKGATRLGHKIASVASDAQKYTGAAASLLGGVPVLGTAAALANKFAMASEVGGNALSAAGTTASGAIGAGQNIVRTGRSMMEARGGGDVRASMRDIQREAGNITASGQDLRSQAKAMGTKLQRG